MNRKRIASALVTATAALALIVGGVTTASAQVQSKDQQGCINTLNKSGQKVLATQGKEISSCVKNAGGEKLGAVTAQDCLTLDAKGKVGKAQGKTEDGETKKCPETPSFAYSGSATTNAVSVQAELDLVADIFGADLDSSIILASSDKDGAKCQASIVKSYEKLTATFTKEFNGCKKNALKGGASLASEIGACVGDDPKNKIDKTETKLVDSFTKKCGGVNLGTAFPAVCSGGDDGATCGAKVVTAARCRACEALVGMDALVGAAGCDVVDDGVANGSCSQCGNGILEIGAGETCDDGNLTDGDCCDSTCQQEAGTSEGPQGDGTCSDTLDNDCDGLFDALDDDCADPQCPNRGEVLLLAGVSSVACANNTDCGAVSGRCDVGLGRCVSDSQLDSGYSGIAHGSDIVDQVSARAVLSCPTEAGGTCGTCEIVAVDGTSGNCRCADDNRTQCNEPFEADFDDCGGATCNCYLGPPLPLSAGNTPACVVNRVAEDVSGTANIDTGVADISVQLRAVVHLGIDIFTPCPSCDGDVTPGDGVRDGTCTGGANDGETCDVDGESSTFPALTGGGGSSIDCLPDPGKNVSGAGLKIDLSQSTASVQSLSAGVKCGFEGIQELDCPCSVCDNDASLGCSSNADCVDGGVCQDFFASGVPLPNSCSDGVCTDVGGEQGECMAGPSSMFCDGILRANGKGFVACLSNGDCGVGAIGVDAGDCTITEARSCFLDPIVATPTADPNQPVAAAVFCVAPTSNGGINTVTGLPGPARVLNEALAETICPDGVTVYTPGVGGCP